MRTLILAVTACMTMTACATGPSMSITTYSMSMTYWRDCVGLDAKYRAGDEECRSRSRPEPQWGAVKEVDTRKFSEKANWEQVEMISYCRSNPDARKDICQDLIQK
jgi:hypothetical protein